MKTLKLPSLCLQYSSIPRSPEILDKLEFRQTELFYHSGYTYQAIRISGTFDKLNNFSVRWRFHLSRVDCIFYVIMKNEMYTVYLYLLNGDKRDHNNNKKNLT